MLRNYSWWVISSLGTLFWMALGGCAPILQVHVESGNCLNPPERYCAPDGENSLVLEVRIYQLRDYVDPAGLKWQDLVKEGNDLVLLKPYLSDPEKTTMVRHVVYAKRSTFQQLEFPRLKGTRYLLVVAAGRYGGEESIDIKRVRFGERSTTISLEQFDVRFPSEINTSPR